MQKEKQHVRILTRDNKIYTYEVDEEGKKTRIHNDKDSDIVPRCTSCHRLHGAEIPCRKKETIFDTKESYAEYCESKASRPRGSYRRSERGKEAKLATLQLKLDTAEAQLEKREKKKRLASLQSQLEDIREKKALQESLASKRLQLEDIRERKEKEKRLASLRSQLEDIRKRN